MPDLGPHAGFILWSYAITLAVFAGLVVWTRRDTARQRRLIADLEERGVRRGQQPRSGS